MTRTIASALASAAMLVASAASAQTTIIVETPPPPPPVIVVIETPTPPPPVLGVAEAAAPGRRPRFVLDLRGDVLIGAGYDGAALGGSVLGGFVFGEGASAQLALGYASAMGWGPNELNLGIEVQRDFSPADAAGFVLIGRIGTAFLLDDRAATDSGIRLSGQIGIGGRFDLSPDLAITIDLRGVLRYHPDDGLGPSNDDLAAGLLTTMGLRIRM